MIRLFITICLSIYLHNIFSQEHHLCKSFHHALNQEILREASQNDDNNIDITFVDFNLRLDPSQKKIEGNVNLSFKSLIESLNKIKLQLSNSLKIDSITNHGKKLNYTHSSNYNLSIDLDKTIKEDSSYTVNIYYKGVPQSTGFGSFTQSFHAGQPLLFSFSVPYASRDWWPCKNGNADKVDSISMNIITPEKFYAASNGKLISEQGLANGLKEYRWKHSYPIVPYLIAFAITNYTTYEEECVFNDGEKMQVLNFVYPESLNSAKVKTPKLLNSLVFLDSLFIPYPFKKEKYGHAQFSWGGGMEHQTLSFVENFEFGLLSHELAHQWFGNMVTCASWKDCWLNEGFATYLEGLCQERFNPSTWLNWKRSKINNITSSPSGSVFVPDTTNLNRIFDGRLTYHKGAMILHQLRWLLGDEAFFQGIRNYLLKIGYGVATTNDLKVELEKVSGRDLTEYFKDYYYGQGYPKFQIKWQQDANNKIVIEVNQTQSSTNVSLFEIDLPLKCIGTNNESEVIRLTNDKLKQFYEINLPFECKRIEFDPDAWLISAGNSVIKTDVVSTSDVFSKIKIVPNPTIDFIDIEGLNLQEVQFEIADYLGRKITKEIKNSGNRIDLSSLKPGTYFISFDKSNLQRIVKL